MINKESLIGRVATGQAKAILFISLALCAAGIYSASTLPSSVFPQTNFPRVVILVDNGVAPADEMMATVTRPIEEAMKDIPGTVTVRSATGRGSAEVNVFFNWSVDMVRSELFVLSRLSQIRSTLPVTATASVYRLTFSAFPIIGVSVTSPSRDITNLWEIARYKLKFKFLQIPGVARVDLVGGRAPEYHVVVEPQRLEAAGLSLQQLTDALTRNNLIGSSGMHEENHHLYLTVVDGRLRNSEDIENLTVTVSHGHPLRIKDVAHVERGPEPIFNIVTAEGVNAVLINVRSQPDGSTLDIAKQLQADLVELRKELPPDVKLGFFYDQSVLVRSSVRSVWEAIIFGLLLSVVILYAFLKSWGTTFVAILVIPVTVLITLLAMSLAGLSFNLMTLGGIAAAIGLVIDDAIVVVEAIHTGMAAGGSRREAVSQAIAGITRPLVCSTLTPVVVFIPLAFLSDITGVFFRALALTMVVGLLTSLLLALTLTPSLAAWLAHPPPTSEESHPEEGGFILRRVLSIYERSLGYALRHRFVTLGICFLILGAGVTLYFQLESEFLPPMDEGGFVIDYYTEPGTSLTETNRVSFEAEKILRSMPEVEGYSRRLGARLALAIAEPHVGDFLVKLKDDRKRPTDAVIADLRQKLNTALPGCHWEFSGILSDLIGDLMWAPAPIEIKVYSTDQGYLKEQGPRIESILKKVPGVVDTFPGLTYVGPSIDLRVRTTDAERFGLTAADISSAVQTAMIGQLASAVLEGDRLINVRVLVDPKRIDQIATLRELPIRTPSGALIRLGQVVDVTETDAQLELRRENMRQDIAVTARLEGRDLGSAMAEIRNILDKDPTYPPGTLEYGGLYQQQQQSFRNLLAVLAMAIVLVFTILLFEFRGFLEPVAIVFGATLAMFGSIAAMWLTGTSLNVVSFLGMIIGVGIVAKNGILMLDLVDHYLEEGMDLMQAVVRSGHRRLRPVLMTSMAAALGMLPLAYGIGSGADILRPLAIAVIGALCVSVLLSLVATPTAYYVVSRLTHRDRHDSGDGGLHLASEPGAVPEGQDLMPSRQARRRSFIRLWSEPQN